VKDLPDVNVAYSAPVLYSISTVYVVATVRLVIDVLVDVVVTYNDLVPPLVRYTL
jgi:hypothetical protein